MPLAKEHEVVETLVFDGLHKTLGVRIQVRTPGRELDRLYAARAQQFSKRVGEERIAVMNEVRGVEKKSIDGVGQISTNLPHPLAMGIDTDAADVHRPSSLLNNEEDKVAHRAEEPQCFDREEIASVLECPNACG